MSRASSGGAALSVTASVGAALSLLWDFVCVFRLSRRVNERLQTEQTKGFFPEWEATCRLLALGSEKDLLQMLQSYGFSPLREEQHQWSQIKPSETCKYMNKLNCNSYFLATREQKISVSIHVQDN